MLIIDKFTILIILDILVLVLVTLLNTVLSVVLVKIEGTYIPFKEILFTEMLDAFKVCMLALVDCIESLLDIVLVDKLLILFNMKFGAYSIP